MPEHDWGDELFRAVDELAEVASDEHASSRLKARIYSAMIREQQQTGTLQNLTETRASGHGLCVFESLVQIAPLGEKAKSPFFCWACHARLFAEKVEDAPIFWTNCPYVTFQNR